MVVRITSSLLTLAVYLLPSATALQCRDESGTDIAWWTALKAPKGYIYGFVQAKQGDEGFRYNPGLDISGTSKNHLAETMQQLYSGASTGYVIWNDQPLSKSSVKPKTLHAHSKGVLGFDADGGFFLTHSTPNFPDDPSVSSYQGINDCEKKGSPCGPTHGQLQDGQSYLCVSFDASNLDKVADVLRGDELTIYATNISGLADQYPNIQKIIEANRRGVPTKTFGKEVQAVDGERFKLFGMSPTRKDEPVFLYEQIIEPTLGHGLLVESFKQAGRFPTYCPGGTQPPPEDGFTVDKYSTINVEEISINNDLSWYSAGDGQTDHSKWAVTIPDSSGMSSSRKLLQQNLTAGAFQEDLSRVLCISDINRAGSQAVRGGGALCFTSNPGIWKTFYDIITKKEACVLAALD